MSVNVCVILARGGSKGVKNKNLRRVGGISLVGRSIIAAKNAAMIERVFVSTDSPTIASEAEKFGAKIIWRPNSLSNDQATSESGWLHALGFIQEQYGRPENLVFLQCTSPFTSGAEIDGCLQKMFDTQSACAISVIPSHGFIWRENEDGFGVGVNHDEAAPRQRRQDLPPEFVESGAIYVVKTKEFSLKRSRFCGPVGLYQVDHPAIEIDTEEDLWLAQMVVIRGAGPLPPVQKLDDIKVLAMDFDGVHTDNTVFIDQNGNEIVQASRGDGMGIERLKAINNIKLLIVSKEKNSVVTKRAAKLGIEVYHAIDDKVEALNSWLEKNNCTWCEMLYVGNDINDIEAMQHAAISACPNDAHPSVLQTVDWVLPYSGGRGAIRFLCDTLTSRG
ncbi:pseudaminic acid cytidylyltransferase (plasmid) [Maritalea myrionectae]|uniref:N-acylneuraminate cytidylyltransferase n=1 Tax=Maritalea myrionectae TaxID=454601 RepID=A0A2R4MJI1_9HYPH|nr:acylneuraminate cytidylyltransferase [Maritalea myrionectae]AVX06124.1 pseudaminic acid cytidylyltransferase [Maritalea myrionectae]